VEHLETYEVVSQEESPELLQDTLGSLAAQSFGAFEGVGFDFIEADLEFPALVVEGDNLLGWVDLGIK
jgi:hypothetical protein